jgi:hypothetical protein
MSDERQKKKKDGQDTGKKRQRIKDNVASLRIKENVASLKRRTAGRSRNERDEVNTIIFKLGSAGDKPEIERVELCLKRAIRRIAALTQR